MVDIQDNTPGGLAIYRCNPGLSLIGSSRRICDMDGTWSGEPPTCEGNFQNDQFLVENDHYQPATTLKLVKVSKRNNKFEIFFLSKNRGYTPDFAAIFQCTWK